MYSTTFRHPASVVQKSPAVAARLLSTTPGRPKIGKASSFGGVKIPGLPSKTNAFERAEYSPRTSGTTSTHPRSPPLIDRAARIDKYAQRLNSYRASQSPATAYPERTRSSKPGLSWLGDDEFESTGLAFKLARIQVQRRVAAEKPTGHFSPRKDINHRGDPGPGGVKNDERARTRVKASNNDNKKASGPKKDTPKKPKPKPEQAVPQPSPAPQLPAHVNMKSTDFASLFGASPSLSTAPSTTSTKPTPTDHTSRRVQLALEYRGGDYSRLVSSSLVTSQGSPLVYAESAMVRRKDLGSNRRNGALAIVQGMINKSAGSQPMT